MKKKCILYVVTNNGKTYKDNNAVIMDITAHSFAVSTLIKGSPEQIKYISINFFEGNNAHLSITGYPSKAEEKKGRIEYLCKFKHSVGADKFLNIHKPKRLPGKKGKKNDKNFRINK